MADKKEYCVILEVWISAEDAQEAEATVVGNLERGEYEHQCFSRVVNVVDVVEAELW